MGQRLSLELECIFFIPDFRNAPEVKAPGGMDDVYQAVKHVFNNAGEYGVSKKKILLGGRSGGAYNALGAALFLA